MRNSRAGAAMVFLLLAFPFVGWAGPRPAARDPQALDRLVAWSGGEARIHLHPATGAARFVRLGPAVPALVGGSPAERAGDFLRRHGGVFGLSDPVRQLSAPEVRLDRHGFSHVTYRQIYRGLPVFAGVLRLHFDPQARLVAVNGTFLPGIDLDPFPSREVAELEPIALDHVRREVARAAAVPLTARAARLMVFRSGLARGVPGPDHLAYEIEVAGDGIREFVYIDAHDGKTVDRITGVHELMHRTVHEPAWNHFVIWDEGAPLPYTSGDPANDVKVNGLIAFTGETYDLFANLSGGTYLSWDGASATMHNVWKSQNIGCPPGEAGAANWAGIATNFCDGMASDDVVGHEWTHAYSQKTHGLIYAWQPGALDEAYSDIFGEVVDLIDGAGTDSPGPLRTVGDCTTYGPAPPPRLQVNSPPSIAGSYPVDGASFNPAPPLTKTAQVALVNDGVGLATDGCQPLVGFPAGRIALIDGGTCANTIKVARAQQAGALGAIVISSVKGPMTGSSPSIQVPSVKVGIDDGNALKAQLGVGVTATITLALPTASVRWLLGEDASALGGPIRDLWNPRCFGNPAFVRDANYACAGDVEHTNTGVPNQAFALLVDGGAFRGHAVAPLGLTKAAHVYWRAMEIYQVPDTDFADHADALSQSCADLIGIDLTDLDNGAPTGVAITAADCAAVAQAMLAVGMADPPTCVFEPLLDPDPPPFPCGTLLFSDDFETDPTTTWTRTNAGVYPEYTPRDWEWTAALPPGGTGSALFAVSSEAYGYCMGALNDQSGSMSLESPPIPLLDNATTLRFDHYVATQAKSDGGNLKISVDGGPFVPIQAGSFLFNPYNDTLTASPLAGQPAFTGTDGGEAHGSWGQSQVALGAQAGAGASIRLRFDFGVDYCFGIDGWYVDNVVVCAVVAAAGRVPDGDAASGPPMLLTKAPAGQIGLSWSDSCLATDDDYEIYEGTIGAFTSHAARACTTAGATTATLAPSAGNRYYLVVPRNSTHEGSYGTDSEEMERPPAAAACVVQVIAPGCS